MSLMRASDRLRRLSWAIGRLSAFAVCVLLLLSLTACGGDESSPEEQVRRYIAEGETAAEGRELKRLRELIAENYTDQAKRTRRDLVRLMGGYFFRHKSIHLFTRLASLQIKDEKQAGVVLYVAMAGSPISGTEQLISLRADLHRFELELGKGEDDQWRLLSAHWRRATPDDFIQGN